MKPIISFIVATLVIIIMFNVKLSAQEVIIKSQTGEKKFDTKENLLSIKHESFPEQINKKPLSGIRQSFNTWKLNEDFESVAFPPDQWYAYNGWQQAGYSSYGTGNYSAYFCNFCCTQLFNELRTPYFTLSEEGDVLTFDAAYAPRGDSNGNVTDYLYIYYWNDSTSLWNYLITYDKDSLATAPPTNSAFYPTGTQWKTISVSLPVNTSQIYFFSDDQCGNNLYLDNIKVGQPPANNTVYMSENFSGSFPPAGWNTGSYWIYNSVSAYGIGTGSIMRELYNCNATSNDFITTPVFSPTVSGVNLLFDYAYAAYDYGSFDDLEIYGTSDGGNSFDLITTMSGNPISGELSTAPVSQNYFTPSNSEWESKIVSIPAGTTQLKFKVDNDCSNNLYLDNIKVQDSPPGNLYDAAVMAVFTKSKIPLYYGTPDTISAVILNNSDSSVSLKVFLNINGAGVHLDSLLTNVLPYEYKTVSFDPYNYLTYGSSDVSVSIGSDLNNSNNHKSVSSNVNYYTFRYSDTVINGAINYTQIGSFLNRYRANGEVVVTKVKMNVSNSANIAGQMYYAVVLNENGNLLARSNDYILKSSDANTLLTFIITDPKPYILDNSYFYAGIVQTAIMGETDPSVMGLNFYSDNNDVLRRNANYYGYVTPTGYNFYPVEQNNSSFDFAIETDTESRHFVDVGISDAGLKYDQYFSTNTYTPVCKVFNAGYTTKSFTVTRVHPLGGYTSTKTVSNLAPAAIATVVFDPWTFPVTNIEQPVSIYTGSVPGDGNYSNNSLVTTITPRVAKELCVLWQSERDRDSIVRAINSDGRYVNNFDTVRMNYTGSLKPWKNVYCLLKNASDYTPWLRDSMKIFLDNSTSLNKKSLMIFSDYISNNDQLGVNKTPEDTVFYRQYLKSAYISYDWAGNIPLSGRRFKGVGTFSGIMQDSLYLGNGYRPGLIRSVNGGTAAFKPKSASLSGNDSCNAVCYFGTNYNTFYMTNRYSDLRYPQGSPVSSSVFSKTVNWINSTSSAFTLNLAAYVEGFYNAGINKMTPDTMRVYLRNSSSPYAIIDSAKSVLDSTGTGIFSFNNAVNNTGYYIQVKHRNSIETWSFGLQSFSGGVMNYNFTSSASQAFGNNLKQIDSSPVRFGIYSGDLNKDGTVDLTDVIQISNAANIFASGYLVTDVSGNNTTDLTDVLTAYNNSSAFVSRVKP
ncbi:MAG: hypothetical protein IPL53_23940 [Ignavibacteria bacterium]|nr:hypothetical protein [Ignavibacteria bacterium]